ncbi:class I SAM-dependent methyltransferase [Saccharomonospora piscinae]|uniref:class I SAM-dependent methyltransferase n=1 Tax=Saccharomonospora piscinae TaxID=687388 RepID=UPI000463C770|nr:class I SAM-dependent methyltransferase [Saccharomonospora piscinae]
MDLRKTTVDWAQWLRRWDRQQTGYLPYREERFTVAVDVLEQVLAGTAEPVIVDLGCGPGSFSQRIVERLPTARCLAVDLDPVLLALGRAALGDAGGRITWIQADLMSVHLPAVLGVSTVDAVVSSTALHWLSAERLSATYTQLGGLVRRGGLFLNADNIPEPGEATVLPRMAERARAEAIERSVAAGGEDWSTWWEALAEQPGIAGLISERRELFAGITRDWAEPALDFHVAALRYAGFGEVGVPWQRLDDRVLLAVR